MLYEVITIYIELILPSGTMTIPEGVIAPSAGECQTGFYALFYPSSAKVYGLVITLPFKNEAFISLPMSILKMCSVLVPVFDQEIPENHSTQMRKVCHVITSYNFV